MIGVMSAYCLEMHASYACRHAGACCSAGWHIPVETAELYRLKLHFGPGAEEALFITDATMPDGAAAVLEILSGGTCVFFGADRLCAIHRELGEDALPSACRHFPRVVLRDARGTFVSLSHFCPTAAGLLFDDVPARPIQAPPSLSLRGQAEGLDARAGLPPLLRPGVLSDMEGYSAWERRSLETLTRDDLSAAQALRYLAAATREVQRWAPGHQSLADCVERAFESVEESDGHNDSPRVDASRAQIALESVPPHLRGRVDAADAWATSAEIDGWCDEWERVVKRYLASRLFGNWIAYYGAGLHVIVEALHVQLAVVTMELTGSPRAANGVVTRESLVQAIRATDLLMVHLSDVRILARLLG